MGPTGGGRLTRYCSNSLIRLQTGRVTDYGVLIVASLLLALLSFDQAAFGPATALLPLLLRPLPSLRLLLGCLLHLLLTALYCWRVRSD